MEDLIHKKLNQIDERLEAQWQKAKKASTNKNLTQLKEATEEIKKLEYIIVVLDNLNYEYLKKE